jgi:hypothetical protein
MRLFLYGTLFDAETLATRGGHASLPARLVPATLYGWRRVAMRGGHYPTLRRARTGVVHGGLLIASARAWEAGGLRRPGLSTGAGCR